MASVAGDNARSLSVIADSATERFIRRLFKRKPRQDLPPSPMRGVPQRYVFSRGGRWRGKTGMSNEPEREDDQETTLGEYAGFVTRLIGLIVDLLIVAVVLALLKLVTDLLLGLFPIRELLGLGEPSSTLLIIVAAVASLGIGLLYWLGSWLLVGQTLGQGLVGVRVVMTNGERIGFWRALLRWLGYFVSAILFLGFLWVLVDDKRQGFHDKLAGTVCHLFLARGRVARDRCQGSGAQEQRPA